MEWRIRESSDGSFHAEYGGYIQSGIEAEFKPGFYTPGFRVQKSSRFDTREQAEQYIARMEMDEDMNNKLIDLYERLDNLEGCEDNQIYEKEISEIRSEISDIEIEMEGMVI